MKLTNLFEDMKFEQAPLERAHRINYFRDAILFLRKINETKHNPKIESVIRQMNDELKNLT